MSVSPIGFTPGLPSLPEIPGPAAPGPAGPNQGFTDMVIDGVDKLQGLHTNSDVHAVQAATGDLQDIHDYMIASTKSSVATELTVAVRNKAVEAFTEIMRMQV
jgi:flagellar hook-basal body complex protein FliE